MESLIASDKPIIMLIDCQSIAKKMHHCPRYITKSLLYVRISFCTNESYRRIQSKKKNICGYPTLTYLSLKSGLMIALSFDTTRKRRSFAYSFSYYQHTKTPLRRRRHLIQTWEWDTNTCSSTTANVFASVFTLLFFFPLFLFQATQVFIIIILTRQSRWHVQWPIKNVIVRTSTHFSSLHS